MGRSLIDVFIDKIRIIALKKLAVGYLATNIDLAFLTRLLAFDDAQQCEKFLFEQGKYSLVLFCQKLTERLGCSFVGGN